MERPSLGRTRGIALGALVLLGLLTVTWFVAFRGDPAPAPPPRLVGQAIVVEVRNASTKAGLARRVAQLLRERGVDVIYFGTAEGRRDSTTVLVRRGDISRGHEIARLLGGVVTVRAAADSLLRVDATVLIGADYRLPADRLRP